MEISHLFTLNSRGRGVPQGQAKVKQMFEECSIDDEEAIYPLSCTRSLSLSLSVLIRFFHFTSPHLPRLSPLLMSARMNEHQWSHGITVKHCLLSHACRVSKTLYNVHLMKRRKKVRLLVLEKVHLTDLCGENVTNRPGGDLGHFTLESNRQCIHDGFNWSCPET